MELKGKVEIYYATGKLYRKIYEQELEYVNKNVVVGICKGEKKKQEKVGIEQTSKSRVELRKAEKKWVLRE